MRKLIGLLVLLACMVSVDVFAQAKAEPLRLRVLSYNIHHAEGVDRKLDLERIAKVIMSVQPDIVALQEVDRKVTRSKGVDQPAELAKLTNMHAVFEANIPLQGGEYGNAVLSRVPVKGHANHLLPRFDEGEQRGVLEVELEFPTSNGAKQAVLFLATHLDHRADGRERLASAKAINELVAKRPDTPALLAGDLNDRPESRTMEGLRTAWTPANQEALPTIPVAKPTRQIDFILYRPAERWKVVEVRVLDEAVASDHRAIFAVLEMRLPQPPEK